MAVSMQQRIVNFPIPRIVCPRCGSQMTLSRIEPEGPDNRDRMFFDCTCEFEYCMSDRANKGR